MICFLDRTFCNSPTCENRCGRQLTDDIKKRAEKWWGGPGAPIAVGNFCKTEDNSK